jgi:glycosyltransferase involved in cell wall biosynthesis
MKILVVQESDWLKKGPHQQHQLMERLSLRSHEIRVIDYEILWRTQARKGLFSRRQTFTGVSKVFEQAHISVIRPGILKLPVVVYLSLLLSHRREIERQIREFRPDVIVGLGILNTYLAMKAASRNAIPFIYCWIDVLHTLIPLKPAQPLGKMLEIRTLSRADRVIVINERLRDYVIGLGARPDRTCLVRAGVDLERFNVSINGSAVRKAYEIKRGDLLLFFMGWLYNFSGLKEVALQLAQKDNNIKLLIVGEGDAYNELQRIREKYNLQDRVILTGKRSYEEMPAFVAASDICLLPAYPSEKIMQDIVPIKMHEYMAMKKPVIATRLPGLVKEFGEGNGVVYIDRPEDAVEKAMELAAGGSLNELGSKARRFVKKYSWDNITDEFEGVLEEVIGSK